MKKLKTSFDSREHALEHDGLKGKIFSQIRLFRTDASTSIDLLIRRQNHVPHFVAQLREFRGELLTWVLETWPRRWLTMAAAGTAIVYRGVLTAAEFDPVLAAKVIGRWSATAAGAGTTVLGTHPDYQDMELERRVNALQVGPRA
jgi:hypothetical protein